MANKEEGLRLGVGGTPVVFVNNVRIEGQQSFDVIKRLVDSLNAVASKAGPGKTDTGSKAAGSKAAGKSGGGD
jgi:hypothetical protein